MHSSTARTRNPRTGPRGRPPTDAAEGASRWRSVEDAAAFLGMPVRVLREALASNARLEGGVAEARLDGIIARLRPAATGVSPAETQPVDPYITD